jgi:hypothetical protein
MYKSILTLRHQSKNCYVLRHLKQILLHPPPPTGTTSSSRTRRRRRRRRLAPAVVAGAVVSHPPSSQAPSSHTGAVVSHPPSSQAPSSHTRRRGDNRQRVEEIEEEEAKCEEARSKGALASSSRARRRQRALTPRLLAFRLLLLNLLDARLPHMLSHTPPTPEKLYSITLLLTTLQCASTLCRTPASRQALVLFRLCLTPLAHTIGCRHCCPIQTAPPAFDYPFTPASHHWLPAFLPHSDCPICFRLPI